MNYYMLQRLKGDSPGHPVFFEYTLDRESAGENHRENQFVEFFTGFSGSPLIFLCKHKVLDFDYYDMKAGEYFFSQRLFDAADGLTLPAHAVKAVRFLSRKRTEIAKQDYCVLRIRDLVDAVDPDKSVIEQSQQYEYRKITKHLALDRAALGELDLLTAAAGKLDESLADFAGWSLAMNDGAEPLLAAGASLFTQPEPVRRAFLDGALRSDPSWGERPELARTLRLPV